VERRRSLAFVISLACVAFIAMPAPASAVVTVPMIQEHGVLYVQAQIDGVGPLLLTFDPGGEDVYTSYARNKLAGRASQKVCLATACFATSMKYLDGDPGELDPHHDTRHGVIAGSIGPSLLQHYVTTIDYQASSMILSELDGFRPPSDAQRLPLTFDSYGLPVVPGVVDGITTSFELDLRAPTSMLFRPFLARTGLDRLYAATPIVKESNASIAHAIRVVQLGGFELHDVAFWFSTATSGKFANDSLAGLLGNNVLSHFLVTLDVPHRCAYLTGSRSSS
jgi:hypothetical protein